MFILELLVALLVSLMLMLTLLGAIMFRYLI